MARPELESIRIPFACHNAAGRRLVRRATLRITPAMQFGVTDHVWTISELAGAALNGVVEEPTGRKVGRFTVIDGGAQ